MKKSLLAIAAMAAASGAFAQSSLQIDGILDAGVQRIDYKGTTVTGIGGNGSSTSQINFRGTEDLGGGLSARFRVETDWNVVSNKANTGTTAASGAAPVTGSTFGNGEIRVGVAGAFGALDLGSVNYNTLGTYGVGQPFGTAIGSGFRAVAINDAASTSSVRAENALKYVSPNFSGVTVSLYKSFKQTKAGTGVAADGNYSSTLGAYDQYGVQELGLNYAGGPLAASFSTLKQDNEEVGAGTAPDYTVNTLGVNYNFGTAKAFFLYQTVKGEGVRESKLMTLSGTYTLGATVLMAQVGSLNDDVQDKKDKMISFGADYNLSKRSAVYVRYESIDDKLNYAKNPGSIAGTAGETTRTRTAIGVRHSF
ncbi:porin [Ideonella livida]|uniref:Porin n=1 Tax=Ideonella livida TaxID=2707176 RepID=A0A7C9TMF4_9BURK|nr:porin [Ideonella livida]NDY92307.1 porin [Ideonella livida]